jgi:hypothetical protein
MKLLEYKPSDVIPLNQVTTCLRELAGHNDKASEAAIDLILTVFKFSDRGAQEV